MSSVSKVFRISFKLRGSTSPITNGQRGRLPSQLVADQFPIQNTRPLECLKSVDMLLGEKKASPSVQVHTAGWLQVSPPSLETQNHFRLGSSYLGSALPPLLPRITMRMRPSGNSANVGSINPRVVWNASPRTC
ncbi:MAG: hypothetical protein BWX84_02156 [Verrucomicrobia bacterium ADurb.Bin118]|nr:MAG: hypothetical protein BWX84_02156 [Verrucomicrobia bacterium ADurb.Bin118]